MLERGTGGVFVTHCELLESKATMMDEAWTDKEHDVATLLKNFVRKENDTTQKVWCIWLVTQSDTNCPSDGFLEDAQN